MDLIATKEFRASIFANVPWGRFITCMVILFVLISLLAQVFELTGVLILMVGIAALRLRFRRMIFSQDSFHYDGWWTSITIPVAEVSRVVHGHSFPYPWDRLRSGQLCIITTRSKYWIQPIWFGPEACRELSKRFAKH